MVFVRRFRDGIRFDVSSEVWFSICVFLLRKRFYKLVGLEILSLGLDLLVFLRCCKFFIREIAVEIDFFFEIFGFCFFRGNVILFLGR